MKTPVTERTSASNPNYTRYHPRWYRRRMPIFWWLGKWPYTKFIIRELTSLAVGYSAALLLMKAWTLSRGPEAHEAFLGFLGHPWVLAFHAAVLVGLLVHTVTWLNLAPKAIVLRVGAWRVPDGAIILGHYVAWAALSALVLWLVLGG